MFSKPAFRCLIIVNDLNKLPPHGVIANEVKQCREIAASLPAYRHAGAPRNDYFIKSSTTDFAFLFLRGSRLFLLAYLQFRFNLADEINEGTCAN